MKIPGVGLIGGVLQRLSSTDIASCFCVHETMPLLSIHHAVVKMLLLVLALKN